MKFFNPFKILIFILSANLSAQSYNIPSKGLVGYFSFDSSSKSEVYCDSGIAQGTFGTLNNAFISSSGKKGNSLNINPEVSGSYVSFDQENSSNFVFNGKKQMSVALWIKPRLLNNERQQILGVLSKHGGVTYYLEISEKSEFNAFISTVSNDGQEKYGNAFSRDVFNKLKSKSLNRWIHIAFTFNGKSMKLYVDGKLNVDSPVKMPENIIVPWSNNLFIGAKRVSAKNLTESQFSGEIDELYFYNNELTVSEIKQLIDDAPLTME